MFSLCCPSFNLICLSVVFMSSLLLDLFNCLDMCTCCDRTHDPDALRVNGSRKTDRALDTLQHTQPVPFPRKKKKKKKMCKYVNSSDSAWALFLEPLRSARCVCVTHQVSQGIRYYSPLTGGTTEGKLRSTSAHCANCATTRRTAHEVRWSRVTNKLSILRG